MSQKKGQRATAASAVEDAFFKALKEGDAQGARRALDQGASPLASADRETPLFWLLTYGFDKSEADGLATLKELLSRAPLSALEAPRPGESNAKSALHVATLWAGVSGVEELARAGADLEAKDAQDDTPLHWAVRSAKPETIRALLRLGASPEAKNFRGERPEDSARDNGMLIELRAAREALEISEHMAQARQRSAASRL